MRYEKPLVLDIGARPVIGQGPDMCVAGPAAIPGYQSCVDGTDAYWSCTPGTDVVAYGFDACVNGGAADYMADCLSGTVVWYYCAAGTDGGTDPQGCVAGPLHAGSPAP